MAHFTDKPRWPMQGSTEAFLGTTGAGRSARQSRATGLVQQSAVSKLLKFLAQQGQPDPLLSVLRAVDADAVPVPADAMQDTDPEGRSFLTRWLPSWIRSQQAAAPSMPEGGESESWTALLQPLFSNQNQQCIFQTHRSAPGLLFENLSCDSVHGNFRFPCCPTCAWHY